MQVVNPQAAGIDVGSRSHWVAVGQSEKDMREYGVFNQDLFTLADWLKEKNVKTVTMESTGTYWQNLYAVLISRGFCYQKSTQATKMLRHRFSLLVIFLVPSIPVVHSLSMVLKYTNIIAGGKGKIQGYESISRMDRREKNHFLFVVIPTQKIVP